MEIKTELKIFEVNYLCPGCGKHNLKVIDNDALLSMPPYYKHMCPSCDYSVLLEGSYPKIVYEYV